MHHDKDTKLGTEEFGIDIVNSVPEGKMEKAWNHEKARMSLAYWVLSAIFVFFLLVIACHVGSNFGFVNKELSTALLEICRTGLLPIVTLILGYYFSNGK
jgi:hypothetical protein